MGLGARPAASSGLIGKERKQPAEVFPLPRLRLPAGPDYPVSRPVRDRLRRRWAENAKLNESVDALNALSTGRVEDVFRPRKSGILADVATEGDARRSECLRGLIHDIKRYQDEVKKEMGGSGHEAFRALLARHEVAAYSGGEQILPSSGMDPYRFHHLEQRG